MLRKLASGKRSTSNSSAERRWSSRTSLAAVGLPITWYDVLLVLNAAPDDRRSSFAAISAAGRDRLRSAAPTYLHAIDQHFTAHLTARDIAAVTAALRKVVAAEE